MIKISEADRGKGEGERRIKLKKKMKKGERKDEINEVQLERSGGGAVEGSKDERKVG